MRLFFVVLAVFGPTGAFAADSEAASLPSISPSSDFRLGGAVDRAALVPDVIVNSSEAAQSRLSLPRSPGDRALDLSEATLGPATLFVGEGIDDGRDAVQMGTFLSRGAARAGVSFTYLSREEEVARSELFVDYALTEQLSVGVSGILNTEIDSDQPVPQVGVSAEYATEGGAFLQGGFAAGSSEYEPVVGLSIGLRF